MELIEAAKKGDVALVRRLLQQKADASFYYKSEEGFWGEYTEYSVIHKALELKNKEKRLNIVKLLLQNKADLSKNQIQNGSRTTETTSPLELAKNDFDLFQLLLKNKANPDQIIDKNHAASRSTSENINTLLTIFATNSNNKFMECLLNSNASPNFICTSRYYDDYGENNDKKESALHICIRKGNQKAINLLLNFKADVNLVRHDLLKKRKIGTSKKGKTKTKTYCPSKAGRTRTGTSKTRRTKTCPSKAGRNKTCSRTGTSKTTRTKTCPSKAGRGRTGTSKTRRTKSY